MTKIKKIETDLIVEFVMHNQPIDFTSSEVKIESVSDHSSLILKPVLNLVDFFLPLNYFKYNRNKNARDQPTQYWSINSHGIFNWDATANSLHRLGNIEDPDILPAKASTCSYKNRFFISGGVRKEKNRMLSTNEVSIIEMVNSKIVFHSYLNMPRFGHVMIPHNDKLFVMGGYEDPSKKQVLNTVEFFHMHRREWIYLKEMNFKRAEFSAVSMLNHIVAFFGANNGKILNSVEAYDPNDDTWYVLKNFPTNIYLKNHHVQAINFRSVLIFGGLDENEKPNFDFYSVSFDNLINGSPSVTKLVGRLPTAVINPFSHYEGKELTIFGDKMYKFKYIYSQKLNFFHCESQDFNYQNYLDDAHQKVDSRIAYYGQYRASFCDASMLAETSTEYKYLYIFGIENIPHIYRVNLETMKWEILQTPNEFVFQDYACAVPLLDGSFLIAGGLDGKCSRISKSVSHLVYNDITKGFDCSPLPDMVYARYTFTGIYLKEFVYVIGGRQLGSVK